MKKTLFTIAAALALLCLAEQPSGSYLTWLGNNAGKDATANQSEFVGALSGQNAHDIYRSSFLGVMSGYNAFGIYNCFAAGIGALANATNVSGSVFIGPYAGRGARDVSGRTDINGQFFSDKGRDEFRIVTDPAKPVPVHYKGGILREQTDFAIRTDDADRAAWVNAVADVWLSAFDGSDANDGLSPTSAVKTIAGAYNAAYRAVTNGTLNASNEVVVAVAEGVYAPASIASAITNGIAYVATGDRKDTIVNGMLSWWLSGNTHTNGTAMAFTDNPCRMTGFTLTSFNRRMKNARNAQGHRMMTHGIRFERCDITGNYTPSNYGWLSGEFVDCDIHGNRVLSAVADQGVGCVFGGWADYDRERAYLTRCHVWDNDFSVCAELFYSSCSATGCLFEVDFYEGKVPSGGHNTIIAKTFSNPHVSGLTHNRSGQFNSNSFVVVAEPGPGYDASIYNPTGSCCVVSNANLTADFVAADSDCPSVRSDGKPDYGYKDSGLWQYKSVPTWAKAETGPTAADIPVSDVWGSTLQQFASNINGHLGGLPPTQDILIKTQDGKIASYDSSSGAYLPMQEVYIGDSRAATIADIPDDVPPTVSNIVTQALVRDRLGVYLYVGEDGGIYVHTGD